MNGLPPLRDRVDWMVDEDPLKLRDALLEVLRAADALISRDASKQWLHRDTIYEAIERGLAQ